MLKLSDRIHLDSEDVVIREQSEEIAVKQLKYAEYLVQTGYVLVRPQISGKNVNLTRILCQSHKIICIIELPITEQTENWERQVNDDIVEETNNDPWYIWKDISFQANFRSNIRLALELSEDIPGEEELKRWLGEPVDYFIIPSHLFISNKNNYPVLPKKLQLLVAKLSFMTPNIMVKASQRDPQLCLYAEYLDHLVKEYNVKDSLEGYCDYLEIPLQPLYDNLDCYTYEVFERDPVKYSLYQQAIEMALVDMVADDEVDTKELVVMIVGAGRGPLVRASLNASAKTGRKIKVYVIEKNFNAISDLKALKYELCTDKDVTIFNVDMRDFKPPQPADILVSELLGSFGDNELSPECLDGAQNYLKPTGISIPCSSTSFINPIMSTKLHSNASRIDLRASFHSGNASTPPNALSLETTYVVYPKNCYYIDDPKPVFHFVHPNPQVPINNKRHTELEFTAKIDCILHGFIGYFEAVLYKDIKISIHPFEHTVGMASWFPCYFPIVAPQFVRDGDKIVTNIWRCVGSRQIWYEWNVMQPITTHFHNFQGHSSPIYK